MNWIQNRINQLESQLGSPEVLDQKRIETKLEAYREILSAARCGALHLANVSHRRELLSAFVKDWYKNNPLVSKEKQLQMVDNFLADYSG